MANLFYSVFEHIGPVRINPVVENFVGGKINIILFYSFSLILYKLRKGRKLLKVHNYMV
jgi:hypothetical protein